MVLRISEGSSVSNHQLLKTVGAFIEDVEEPRRFSEVKREGWRFGAVGRRFVAGPQAWKKQFRCSEGFSEAPYQLTLAAAERSKGSRWLSQVCTRRLGLGSIIFPEIVSN